MEERVEPKPSEMIITIGMTMPAIAKMIWQATTTWSQVIAQPSGPKAAWLRVIGRSALIMESILGQDSTDY
jgi:hypothetical protein